MMNNAARICRPNMANLPVELGRGIITHILKTPKPDFDKMQEDATRIEKEIIEILEKENADTNSTGAEDLTVTKLFYFPR